MVINMICGNGGDGGGYSILKTASYSSSTLSIVLPSQPKLVIVTLRSGSIAANGMFAYASLDPDTGVYVSRIQTRASGSAVTWTDVDQYAVWNEETKTFSMRVRSGTSASGTCTCHAVG